MIFMFAICESCSKKMSTLYDKVEGYMEFFLKKKIKNPTRKRKSKKKHNMKKTKITCIGNKKLSNPLILFRNRKRKKSPRLEETFFKVSETFSDHSLLLPEKFCFVDFPAVPSLAFQGKIKS